MTCLFYSVLTWLLLEERKADLIFSQELENANKASTRELNNEFENCIFDKFEAAIHNAARDAIDTALKWGAPVNRQDRT